MSKQYFDLMQERKFKEVNDMANTAFLSSGDEKDLRVRADTYMFLKDYKNALADYLEIIRLTKPESKYDGDFIDAGIAYWLLGSFDDAVLMWRDGLKFIKYTSNIVNVPAVLYFASAYLRDKKLLNLANSYLKKMWKNKVPIAGFLLGEITKDELLGTVTEEPILRERQLCKVFFYIASDCLQKNDVEGYRYYLKESVTVEGRFLEFEYHLAVGELHKLNKAKG